MYGWGGASCPATLLPCPTQEAQHNWCTHAPVSQHGVRWAPTNTVAPCALSAGCPELFHPLARFPGPWHPRASASSGWKQPPPRPGSQQPGGGCEVTVETTGGNHLACITSLGRGCRVRDSGSLGCGDSYTGSEIEPGAGGQRGSWVSGEGCAHCHAWGDPSWAYPRDWPLAGDQGHS